ncbi:MAG: hypothetical protein ACK40G_01135 [Cytophagaceae bacterium]
MLKANALFTVLIMALVIALLTGSIIYISYLNRLQISYLQLQQKLMLNASSAFNILLAENSDELQEDTRVLDLYGLEEDSVLIKKAKWGIFDIGIVKAFSGRSEYIKAGMYGYKPDGESNAAVYLADMNRPLSVSGNTRLKGVCYLPEAGIRREFIEGKSFTGNKLVDGEIKKSKSHLPALEKNICENVLKFLANTPPASSVYLKDIGQDSIIKSYLDTTLFLNLGNNIRLTDKFYSGNILLWSDTLVEIDANSRLKDVLLFAPAVVFKKGFRGSVQVFAKDSILLEEDVELTYPSALGIFKKDFKVQQPFVRIKSGAKVSGLIFTKVEVQDLRQTFVDLKKNSLVKGQIYADGYADIKGRVEGSVMCNKFILYSSYTYENYLLDAEIDVTLLSDYYVGSSLLPSQKKKRIVKWLN